MAKKNSGGGSPNTRANMSAEENAAKRREAQRRKKANAGGRSVHNAPDLNRGRNSRFIAWAKTHPVEACLQADAEADKGDEWKLDLVRKHHIGRFVDRRRAPRPAQAPKSAPASLKLPCTAAKVAELETEVGAAKTEVRIAQVLHRNPTNAIAALSRAEKALNKALAANRRAEEAHQEALKEWEENKK